MKYVTSVAKDNPLTTKIIAHEKVPGQAIAYLTEAATLNCQLAVVGNGQLAATQEGFLEALKQATTKSLYLFDIYQRHVPVFKDKVKEVGGRIIFEQNYGSTNGSSMCILLVKLKGA